MKTFLAAWIAAANETLAREMTGPVELRPSTRLPQPETAITLKVTVAGGCEGSFLVVAERDVLETLLRATLKADGEPDANGSHASWQVWMQQIAEQAARSWVPAADSAITVEDGAWELGRAAAAYEMVLGETRVPMAFVDEVQGTRMDAEPQNFARDSDGSESAAKSADGRVDLLLDVELETSLRFGAREMPLSAVLDLGAGDVVELDRHVSDPVDLLVGDKIVARGEVVLVNGAFGLRVTEVAEPRKRLESIRCLF